MKLPLDERALELVMEESELYSTAVRDVQEGRLKLDYAANGMRESLDNQLVHDVADEYGLSPELLARVAIDQPHSN